MPSHHAGRPGKDPPIPSPTWTDTPLTSSAPSVLPLKRPAPVELDPKFGRIKRIRLNVKPPPAEYTTPDQRPPKPKFGKSVDAYLDSYISIEDNPVPVSQLEVAAIRDARLYDRIAALRAEGKLQGRSERPAAAPVSTEPKRPSTHWDTVILHIGIQTKRMHDGLRAKQNTTRRISRAVLAHFERVVAAEDRERQAEERRLRALAKFTVREVMKKWREAISHVREVKLVREKEELSRQGKKQLHAILEQSTHVLEAQHLDLTRGGRSQSASTPASWGESQSGSDDETDYGSEAVEEVEEEAEATEDDAGAEDEDVDNTDEDERGNEEESEDEPTGEDEHHAAPEYVELLRDDDEVEQDASALPESPELGDFIPSRHSPRSASTSPVPLDEEPELPGDRASAAEQASPSKQAHDIHGSTVPSSHPNGIVHTDPMQPGLDETPTPKRNGLNGYSRRSSTLPITEGMPLDGEGGQQKPLRTAAADEDDPDFFMDVPHDLEEQDRQMEEAMEEEEEDHNEDSDEELGGLQEDANEPIEVLLRQYGYALPEDDVDTDNGSGTATNEGQPDNLVDAGSGPLEGPEVADNGDDHAEEATPIQQDKKALELPAVVEVSAKLEEPSDALSPLLLEEQLASGESERITTMSASRHKADVKSTVDEQEGVEGSEAEHIEAVQETESEEEEAVVGDSDGRVRKPFLLRGTLRPYQHGGLEWLVSLYNNGLNGILADEMGLGKTIQTIALLAHLACDRGIWGPHLIIVPTSVLLNWEMEFKRFLPGFKILTYYGSIKERKEKRHGWNTEFHFNVCITSYQLVLADQHIFRRKQWRYMILDEAHNIKNFRSQRWQTLLGFHSQRRLLLTGTPLQNNLMELWSLLYFLMPSGLSEEFSAGTFAGQKQFAEWFSNPMDKAIGNTAGSELDEETQETVNKLHTLLRPYILRRMKSEVEKQLPAKYDHIVECRLSKRQRLLYDEFMQRATTRETLASGSFLSVVNLLMQLRKICNHPDLFEVRPILTSFTMERSRSAVADFEIKELLLRRRLLVEDNFQQVDLGVLGLVFTRNEQLSAHVSRDTRILDATSKLPFIADLPEEPPPYDTVTIAGFTRFMDWQERESTKARWQHMGYLNSLRCIRQPIYGFELLRHLRKMHYQVVPLEEAELNRRYSLRKLDRVHSAVQSYKQRVEGMSKYIDQFAFATPAAVALDLPRLALAGLAPEEHPELLDPAFDTLHAGSVKLQIAFPEARLLQYDCGKLQELDILLRERKAGNHRVLIFTQMTKVLDILEIFLNLHGYRYLRLDGATKVEQRQLITERFNADQKVFAFIASSRSGGVGINLTGADTVIFYDSDFNPAMDRQCEDRAHRIGQTRDVHIYRFITKHTIEENMLLTANHKRALDDVVIRQGDFDWRKILVDDLQMEQALAQVEDQADAEAARVARNEETEDVADFEESVVKSKTDEQIALPDVQEEEEEEDVGGTTIDYMVAYVERDWEYFGAL